MLLSIAAIVIYTMLIRNRTLAAKDNIILFYSKLFIIINILIQ